MATDIKAEEITEIIRQQLSGIGKGVDVSIDCTAVPEAVLESELFERATLVDAQPLTGRTHQIRVHFQHIRHPLLGDPIYGHARGKRSVQPLPDGFNRQALHAWRLGLIHPTTGREISWRADVPEDIEALAAELGLGRDDATDLDPADADFIEEEGYDAQARGGWDESQPIEYDDDDDDEE